MEKLQYKKQVYLLRHGDTGFSGKFIGSTDVPLSTAGISEARRAGLKLKKIEIEKVICSPMLRCRQTADKLSLALEVEYQSSLREVDFGQWETKTFDEISGTNQDLIDLWISNYSNFYFPKGESVAQFVSRLSDLVRYLKEIPEQKILLITHGGVIRHLLCLLLSLPMEKYLSFDIKTAKYCSLSLFNEGAVLTGVNL